MKKQILFLFILFLSVNVFAYQKTLTPVGKTKSFELSNINAIIIPEKSTDNLKKSAENLKKYLSQIYSVDFVVLPDNNANNHFISIGDTEQLKNCGLKADLNADGYSIQYKDGNIFIFGGYLSGAENGVYALLEEDLGCRFWDCGGDETIPQIKTKEIKFVPRSYNPPFITRDPWSYEKRGEDFSRRNRLRGYGAWGFVHTSFTYVPKSNFDAHPEWFSMVNGKREPKQLCYSNPEVIDEIYKFLKSYMDAYDFESYAVSPQDGHPLCDCPVCNELDEKEGTKAATLIKALNTVCERLEKDHPNKKLVTLAYLDYITPPKTIKPHQNLIIQICSDCADWPYPFLAYNETDKFQRDIQNWVATGCETLTWNYVVNFDHYLMPSPNTKLVANNIKLLNDYNVDGVFLQGNYGDGIRDSGALKTWIWAKLLWNPNLDYNYLLREFINGYYGSSAKYVLEYHRLLDKLYDDNHKKLKIHPNVEYTSEENPLIVNGIRWGANERLYTDKFIEKSMDLMDKALKAAQDDETREKVRILRTGPIYLYLTRHVGFYEGGATFIRGDFDPKKKNYYLLLTDELSKTLTDLNIKTVAETAPFENKDKYINKFYETIENDSSDLTVTPLESDNWEIHFSQSDNENPFEAPFSNWQKISIGKTWDEQGFPLHESVAWYRKNISFSREDINNKHIFIAFGACDEDATVYINGEKVLEHTCEALNVQPIEIYTMPVVAELTKYIKEGDNEIYVKVNNVEGAGGIYKEGQIIYTDSDNNVDTVAKKLY